MLIVDDAAAIVQVLQRFLGRQGFDVAADHSAEAALSRMRGGDLPDLVIADLVMPGIGGHELVGIMRDEESLRGVPVVLMSGAGRSSALRRPEGDYQGWIDKPFELQDLLLTVRRVLGREA